MKKLLPLLESRAASAFCLLFAIANRVIFASLYSTIGRDTKVQLTYTENLLAGKGMGVVKYFTTNLNTPVFDTHWYFPPGFSLTIIPFLKLSGGNEYNAVLAFDIAAAILFVFSIRVLVKNIGIPVWLNNIITVIAGCAQYPFFMSYSCTDIISVTLVLFGLSAMIAIADKKPNLSIGQIVVVGCLFFLPSFFRYMYLPVTVLLPLSIVYYGFSMKNQRLRITGIKLMLSTFCFLAILFGLSALYSGGVVHVYNAGRGLFPDQLIHWYPFLPASFINLDFAAQLIAKLSAIDYNQAIFLFEIINVALFLCLLVLFTYYFARNKKNLFAYKHNSFIIMGSVISLVIILMLTYLSFTYKAQDWGSYKWTYNYDFRYFAFTYIFILLLFFTVMYNYGSIFKKILARSLAVIITLCLTVEVLHGIYYNVKILARHEDLAYIRNADVNYREFPSIITELKTQYADRQIFVCSPDQFYLQTATQMGCKSIFDYANLNNTPIHVTTKSVLVLVVGKEDRWIMDEYIQKHKPGIKSIIADTEFFIQAINPHQ